MNVSRTNRELIAILGYLSIVRFLDAKRNLSFDLILNLRQSQEVLGVSVLIVQEGN